MYRWMRKNKLVPKMTDTEMTNILTETFNGVKEALAKGKTVTLPQRLGSLMLIRNDYKTWYHKGKLHTNLPVNWQATFKLWEEDPEAKAKKTLVRKILKGRILVVHASNKNDKGNLKHYSFMPELNVKKYFNDLLNEGLLDACLRYKIKI